MTRNQLFVKPELAAFSPDPAKPYWGPYLTYSHYNFLRSGWVARNNCRRLEAAIELAEPYFGRVGALDVGCADGILLPSLARLFPHVTGVDSHESTVATARALVSNLALANVQVVCNNGLSLEQLRPRLDPRGYGVMFLLETLEHVGQSPATMYDDKLAFLDEMFSLMGPGGAIVASVPKVLGPPLLGKYIIQTITRAPRQKIPLVPLLRASLLYDVSQLEPMWQNGHVGFSHLKLGRLLHERFHLVRQRSLAATMLWLLTRR